MRGICRIFSVTFPSKFHLIYISLSLCDKCLTRVKEDFFHFGEDLNYKFLCASLSRTNAIPMTKPCVK